MNFLHKLNTAQRLAGALALLLALLGGSTALSLLQTQRQDIHLAYLDSRTLPAVRLLRELSGQVDDLRGMLALHVMLSGSAEANALEGQMLARRQVLSAQLAAHQSGQQGAAADATERALIAAVQTSLALFLAEQDKLLALSRQGLGDASAAAQARSLLTGPSQQAYQQLGADLAAWWAHVERRAGQTTAQARSEASNAAWGLLALVTLAALLAAACAGSVVRAFIEPMPAPLPPGAETGDDDDAGPVSEFVDAVSAARAGPVSVARRDRYDLPQRAPITPQPTAAARADDSSAQPGSRR